MTRRDTSHGLVTSEGVNEGSRKSAAESDEGAPERLPAERLTAGGRPEAADEQDVESVRHDSRREVIAGPWGHRDPGAPSLEQVPDEAGADG